jgi:guanylate kinase
MNRKKRGILLVISGPAGSGKGTVVSLLRGMLPGIGFSVSATTRAPRPGERDGVHYFYITRAEFEEKIARGEILEHTEYCGNLYGTLRSEAERVLGAGEDLILEIETDGAMQIKRLFPDAVAVMLLPPDAATLEERLRGRGTETEEVIRSRLARAREELLLADRYDYIAVNETGGAEKCAADIAGILAAERLRPCRMKELTDRFFEPAGEDGSPENTENKNTPPSGDEVIL